MKKLIIAASIIAGCSIYVFANTSAGTDCSKDCPKGSENCVCLPTPDGGCVCVPKTQGTAAATPAPATKDKANCPNTPDCICE